MSKGYTEMGTDEGLARWLPWWLSGKESTCNAGDISLIPWLNPLQYSCLGNPMDRGGWQVPWGCKSWT